MGSDAQHIAIVRTLLGTPPLAGAFVALMLSAPDGAHRAFLFVVLTVCSDVGGYFAGILLGWRYATGLVKNARLWGGRAATLTALKTLIGTRRS